MSNLVRYKRSAEAAPSILRVLADGELVQLVVEHDPAALGILFERHTSAAFALALRLCGERHVAEDVVQEAFLSLWRSACGYDPRRGDVRAWVLGIVHHRAIDALRRGVIQERARVREECIAERLQAAELTEQEFARRDEARKLRALLVGLPPEQSRVIALAYYGGLSHAEIAMALDTPVGTIKGRMRLGLEKMRSQLRAGERTARAARGRGPRALTSRSG